MAMTKLPTFIKTLFSTTVIIYDGVYEFDVCIDKSSGLLIFKIDIKRIALLARVQHDGKVVCIRTCLI